ncbi:hypothetical protein HJC23_008750 [Cyclotella cryptica]|uniref:C2H2-type domain-containing protein n=1 Tax=Cyclotella cryptica TaxID=29204 RepID=A0ABD3PD34_9STRA|eukprot:CCRYP_015655-RA/>CCRYP_015655-RA protein AED:0.47 eAED:0.46 QI:0/-1/0/1/-1/1/1/0/533
MFTINSKRAWETHISIIANHRHRPPPQHKLTPQIQPKTMLSTPNPLSATLTSTTAPGKTFSSRLELQTHYKSDWHRYNLKRRENGLPMLNEEDFNARLEAALALRREREGREERSGVDHLKDGKRGGKANKEGTKRGGRKENRRKPAFAKREERSEEPQVDVVTEEIVDAEITNADEEQEVEMEDQEEDQPEIDPNQSLFDNHVSPSLTANLTYMTNTYSFYLPDPEYCIDVEGIIGYCSEKIRLGRTCLYCQRIFTTSEGCMKHMRDKRHCKILYERGVDQEEFDVFYDFEEANAQFLGRKTRTKKNGDKDASVENAEDEEGEWEDVDEDDQDMDEENDDDNMEEDDDLYAAYQEEIATHGFDITPLGELIFPDGRIIGHRGLARYYKQRFAPDRMERAAVRAARVAAGDRLYGGRVVNLYRLEDGRREHGSANAGEGDSSTAMVSSMGRMAGSIPTGRNGKGILVFAGGSTESRGGFTSLSLYRYRAAVKKQRREDDKGSRLQYRTKQNMNKMNKKGNILSTGFSTAMAPR